MSKKGEFGGQKKLTQATLDHIATIVNKLFADTGLNMREAEELWKIDKSTLSHARNANGAIGVHFLMRLRALTGLPIEEFLRFEPLLGEEAPPRQAVTFETTVQYAPTPAAFVDFGLQDAAAEARAKGIPQEVIDVVVANQAMGSPDRERRRRHWLRAFEKTWKVRESKRPAEKPPERHRRAG